jgi:hypothetical protein
VDDGFIIYDDERAKLADRNLALIDPRPQFPPDPSVQLVRPVEKGRAGGGPSDRRAPRGRVPPRLRATMGVRE